MNSLAYTYVFYVQWVRVSNLSNKYYEILLIFVELTLIIEKTFLNGVNNIQRYMSYWLLADYRDCVHVMYIIMSHNKELIGETFK